jgi:CBS domain-containing protein
MDEGIHEEERIVEERSNEASWVEEAMLDRPIRELPTLRQPSCVSRGTSLRQAIERMVSEKIGCILVVDGDRLVGVFTERDVLTKVVDRTIDLERVPVEDLMTKDPECLNPDEPMAYALNKMTVGGFRHVPLTDPDGRPAGLVGMRDIVEYIVDLFPRGVLTLPPSPEHTISRTREGA